jgi:hypothetical protein
MSIMGMNVVLTNLLTPEHIGDEIKPIWPHPLVAWATRKLGHEVRPVCYVRGQPIKRDFALVLGNTLFSSPNLLASLGLRP